MLQDGGAFFGTCQLLSPVQQAEQGKQPLAIASVLGDKASVSKTS